MLYPTELRMPIFEFNQFDGSLLPHCYQNSPSQEDPGRSWLIQTFAFPWGWLLLGWLSFGRRRFVNYGSADHKTCLSLFS